jgi:uncharacterized protein YbjT (DUF2867 family)
MVRLNAGETLMDIVTGSFGYIGRYITRYLVSMGRQVRTLTNHPGRINPFGEAVETFHYDFGKPQSLIGTLQGARTLYNTYWVRFEHQGMTFAKAVENTRLLFDCARHARVQKIVHISVTNCTLDSPLPYYAGKAQQEEALKNCGVPYAIIRPTLVFGREDILVNNIAWLLRRFPLFPVFGSGEYRVQPVYVGDLAKTAVEAAQEATAAEHPIDAIGPEVFSYLEMVQLLREFVGSKSRLVHLPVELGITLGKLVGLLVRDVILTRDEARGLMDEYLTSTQEPNGLTLFSEWIKQNLEIMGSQYSSELDRHWRF